jgi:hypothetical protein
MNLASGVVKIKGSLGKSLGFGIALALDNEDDRLI